MPGLPKEVPVSDLLLDQRNARFDSEQPNQQATLLKLAADPEINVVEIAADIVEQRSTDPTMLLAVVPSQDNTGRYIVLEGNRRVAALKGLENPSLLTPALSAKEQRRLLKLSEEFASHPISTILCRPFEDESEARHWITLRHTGRNKGRGLLEWGSEGKDRYTARHGQKSPAGQVLDFVREQGTLSDGARESKVGILTNIKRLIGTPEVRERLGIDIIEGKVLSHFPPAEIARSLSRLAEDLLSKDVKVKDIYHRDDRIKYANSLPSSDLPRNSTRLSAPIELSGASVADRKTKRKAKKPTRSKSNIRRTVIPSDLNLDISEPRISDIRIELSELIAEKRPNACAVLLRVFVELSVDHYLDTESVMSEQKRHNTNLAQRMKAVADDLFTKAKIDKALKRAAYKVADSKTGILAASVFNMNQYIHNKYVRPKESELTLAWDELQPLIVRIWPEII